MGSSVFEFFGTLAQNSNLPETVINGRYTIQEDAEKLIIDEVDTKIKPESQDCLMEIGFGSGNIINHYKGKVKHIVGIDHAETCKRYLNTYGSCSSLELIGENFLTSRIDKKFTKIIAYGVINCLTNEAELYNFIGKLLNCLDERGVALIADLPNEDKKHRFQQSKRGKLFSKEWNKAMEENMGLEANNLLITPELEMISYNDKLIGEVVNYVRGRGFNSYLSPQSALLPFGNTREDLLIFGPEHVTN